MASEISLIIPTYNGAHKIVKTLRSLEQQSVLPDEIIIMIDGSTDGTTDILRNNSFNLPSLRIIEQPNGGRAQVRNRGAKEANGSLLIFLDDDMIVGSELVAAHVKHHQTFPNSIVTGVQEPPITEKDFSRFKLWLHEKWSMPLRVKDKRPMDGQNFFLNAANCSMSKTLFEQLNGFDQLLNDSEDYDLSVRAIKAGIKLYYEKDARAYHYDILDCKSFIRRQRQYFIAQSYLSSIKPELYAANNKYEAIRPTGLKALFFRCFCNRLWIESVDNNWLAWLPASIRFKLYDYIVTANGSFFPDKVKL